MYIVFDGKILKIHNTFSCVISHVLSPPLIAIPIPNKNLCQNQPFCHFYTGESVSKATNRLHIFFIYLCGKSFLSVLSIKLQYFYCYCGAGFGVGEGVVVVC